MSFEEFDRSRIVQKPLSERKNKVHIAEIYVKPDDIVPELSNEQTARIRAIADYIVDARSNGCSVMLAFGAHSIKNGLGPLMVHFLERGWITHLATNGAGIIHDWEFAFQGESSESVAENLPRGQFGIWQETGFYLNLAIIAGAYEGLGYGAAVGKAIDRQGIDIPSEEELLARIGSGDLRQKAAAADFLTAIRKAGLQPGWLEMPAPYADYSLQAGAYRLGTASTDHPMFGHDIIYTHDMCSGAAIGRAAERDFLSFVDSVDHLDGGVYLSLGSAIMSPMVFEKAFSMVQNARSNEGRPLEGHHIAVVDLAEPDKCSPSIRKFGRTNPATMDFLTMDNRAFLLALYQELDRRIDGQAMKIEAFDSSRLSFRPLSERSDQKSFSQLAVSKDTEPDVLPSEAMADIEATAKDILEAKARGASRILTFGTDLIRNGLTPLIREFMERGWITQLATTGTSAVDDWEFAMQGSACEEGIDSLCDGRFGMWRETSEYMNLAVLTGARLGLGLGESLSKVMSEGRICIPPLGQLRVEIADTGDLRRLAASAELLDRIGSLGIPQEGVELHFAHREDSLMVAAAELGVPFTIHPMFGLDVPFMHPACSFAAVGRTAETDFLRFAHSVSRLEDGIYLSVGSSVASPMIFEKALSMSQNVLLQEGRPMLRHKIAVVDLAESRWDWMHNGEPPETRPEYYLRYCKSFSRAKAASMRYICADNRAFFLHLYKALDRLSHCAGA